MEDRVSDLPDELICHILSFLRTKIAVTTSVLSKRWKPLWRSVPTLRLDDFDYDDDKGSIESYERFAQYVCAVLFRRDRHQTIQKFTLTCLFYYPPNVKVWLNAVLQRGVQHLDLSIMYYWLHRQPTNLSAIFTCTTLVVLKLWGLKLQELSMVDLPLLKVLHLHAILFIKPTCLARLLSGCPVLEDFVAYLIDFYYQSTDGEFKTLPKLLRATISMLDNPHYLLTEVVNNVEFLRIKEMESQYSPKVFPMFHNLTHVELVYLFCTCDWLKVVELLQHCPKLQVLDINKDCKSYRVEAASDWQDPQSVPECILLHLNRCYLKGYRGTKNEFQFAKYIMQNGKSLKTMIICRDLKVTQQEKFKMLEKLSSCLKSSTTCKLSFK